MTRIDVERLTTQILQDRGRREAPPPGECFACGRPYVHQPATGDDSSRFCSMLCHKWYDEGKTVFGTVQAWWQAEWRHVAGPPAGYLPKPMGRSGEGFMVSCAGCGRKFKSLGLRYCAPDCRKRERERAENQAAMAEVGMEPSTVKRPCQHPGCTNTIPRWRNGRQVSARARFCDLHTGTKLRSRGLAPSEPETGE